MEINQESKIHTYFKLHLMFTIAFDSKILVSAVNPMFIDVHACYL